MNGPLPLWIYLYSCGLGCRSRLQYFCYGGTWATSTSQPGQSGKGKLLIDATCLNSSICHSLAHTPRSPLTYPESDKLRITLLRSITQLMRTFPCWRVTMRGRDGHQSCNKNWGIYCRAKMNALHLRDIQQQWGDASSLFIVHVWLRYRDHKDDGSFFRIAHLWGWLRYRRRAKIFSLVKLLISWLSIDLYDQFNRSFLSRNKMFLCFVKSKLKSSWPPSPIRCTFLRPAFHSLIISFLWYFTIQSLEDKLN